LKLREVISNLAGVAKWLALFGMNLPYLDYEFQNFRISLFWHLSNRNCCQHCSLRTASGLASTGAELGTAKARDNMARQGSKAVDGTGDSLEPNSEILSCHDLPMKSMDIDGYDRFKYMACIECIVACACQAKVLRAPRCSVGSGAPTIPCLEPQERLEEFSAATWI